MGDDRWIERWPISSNAMTGILATSSDQRIHRRAAGIKRGQYMLRAGKHPIFEVKRWQQLK